MEKETFIHFMNIAEYDIRDNDYYIGYIYGLRRFYHGKNFGEDKKISLLRNRGGGHLQGIADGMAGISPRNYCMRQKIDCKKCNLGNYVLDCKNNRIYD